MERLTNKKRSRCSTKRLWKSYQNGYPRNIPEERFLRLTEYEDSMLLPEQVTLVKTIIDSVFGNTKVVERIRELLKADRENRLIILDDTPREISPCDICESGWGTATTYGYDSCFNHCEKLAYYRKQKEEENGD